MDHAVPPAVTRRKKNMSALYKPQNVEERIVCSMARTLWVNAYANAADGQDLPPDSPTAGAGQDWMDIAPPTPIRAYMQAAVLSDHLLTAARKAAKPRHIQCLWQVFADAMHAEDPTIDPTFYPTLNSMHKEAEEFGHFIIMMSLRTGVSWSDDHEELPFVVPGMSGDVEWYDLKDEP
jgi:hypothetical protein